MINEKELFELANSYGIKLENISEEMISNINNMTNEEIINELKKEWCEPITGYCPLCAEPLTDPFCSDCGDVTGCKAEDYDLHDKKYYELKQIKMFGRVMIKIKL